MVWLDLGEGHVKYIDSRQKVLCFAAVLWKKQWFLPIKFTIYKQDMMRVNHHCIAHRRH